MIEICQERHWASSSPRNLTGPLGMVDTAFVPTASMLERQSAMDIRLPDGLVMPLDLPVPEHGAFESGVASPRHHGRLRPVHPDDAG